MNIKTGQQYNLYYSKDNLNNKKIHIRGIVDDRVIFRCWCRHSFSWVYSIVEIFWFTTREKHLTKIK